MYAANAVKVGVGINQASGTTVAVPYPTGAGKLVTLADVLDVGVSVFNTTTQPTNPAGWTQQYAAGIAAGTAAPWVLHTMRKASSTDVTASAAAGTLTVTVPNNACSASMLAIPDIDLNVPIDVAATTYEPNTGVTAAALPGVTTTRYGCIMVARYSNVSTGNTWTPPSVGGATMTEDWDGCASGGTRSYCVDHGLTGAAGATGTMTATSSGTGKPIASGVAYRPRTSDPSMLLIGV